MELRLGAPVRTRDGWTGSLDDLVIEPVRGRVTDLVVEPRHRHSLARLVPLGLARPDPRSNGVLLTCRAERLRAMTPVAETAYLRLAERPPTDPGSDIGIEEVVAPPRFSYSDMWVDPWPDDPRVIVAYDRIPKGEVELRRKSAVSAGGRRVGHLDGLVVDQEGSVTDVLVERGHLWSRRSLSVPATAVARFANDEIGLGVEGHAVAGAGRPVTRSGAAAAARS